MVLMFDNFIKLLKWEYWKSFFSRFFLFLCVHDSCISCNAAIIFNHSCTYFFYSMACFIGSKWWCVLFEWRNYGVCKCDENEWGKSMIVFVDTKLISWRVFLIFLTAYYVLVIFLELNSFRNLKIRNVQFKKSAR